MKLFGYPVYICDYMDDVVPGGMSEELLRNPQGSAISAFGYIASRECILALNEIIDKIK